MSKTKLGYVLVAAVLLTSLGGYALGQFQLKPSPKAAAVAPPGATFTTPLTVPPTAIEALVPLKAEEPKAARAEETKPTTGRRREAVIKLPVGTFVKDMDVGQYGSGRLTWTFEDDKVYGTIEANVMGVEVELKTEAEFSMSSSGTIYGIVTGFELTHVKIAAGGELGEIAEYAKFAKLAEPLINEMLTDLPFSYQFRLSGDKLTILNYRALLAGPNPLGKIGGVIGGGDNGLAVLSGFQAFAVAIEGTYTAGETDSRDKPKTKPVIRKPSKK
ncbi:hypothetical protein [Frigoriglobus tundricola]|uniref:Uncharacterized protein n=1 Tax=Frigoriglobus tundricola TaxID=2774151 RepID=A0A6M5YM67_9BACT|nr:hypothetical protein [Frigoriglobus tundricola]QJW94042.1 hypothetical protein FTUN_1561 [Frigoriglobus tundricola]